MIARTGDIAKSFKSRNKDTFFNAAEKMWRAGNRCVV